jgi:hypothetical protein
MLFYALLAVAVVSAARVVRRRLADLETEGVPAPPRLSARERWRDAPPAERLALLVMASAALVWIGGVLLAGAGLAMGGWAALTWRRPTVGREVAPMAVAFGAFVVLFQLLGAGGEEWGPRLANAAVIGLPWLVAGLLLLIARRPESRPRTPFRPIPPRHLGVR